MKESEELDDDGGVVLSQEEQIAKLAGCNYSPEQIATYLGISKRHFLAQYNDADSAIRHHYDLGRLTADFEINEKLLDNAKSGNITAAQVFEKNRDRITIDNLKNKIYFGL